MWAWVGVCVWCVTVMPDFLFSVVRVMVQGVGFRMNRKDRELGRRPEAQETNPNPHPLNHLQHAWAVSPLEEIENGVSRSFEFREPRK